MQLMVELEVPSSTAVSIIMAARSQQADRSESSEGFWSLQSHYGEIIDVYREINSENETHQVVSLSAKVLERIKA